MLVSPEDLVTITYKVRSSSSDGILLKWECFRLQAVSLEGQYIEFPCYFKFNTTDDNLLTIQPGLLELNSRYNLSINIHDSDSLDKLSSCSVELVTLPRNSAQKVVPLSIASAATVSGTIDATHSASNFVCSSIAQPSATQQTGPISYSWTLSSTQGVTHVDILPNSTYTQQSGKALRVAKGLL